MATRAILNQQLNLTDPNRSEQMPSQEQKDESVVAKPDGPPAPDRMLKHFEFEHLRSEALRLVSFQFHDLAHYIVQRIEPGPERTVCLRKLLEAKDCAVRAKLHPGG
jgi:hypothetical protein